MNMPIRRMIVISGCIFKSLRSLRQRLQDVKSVEIKPAVVRLYVMMETRRAQNDQSTVLYTRYIESPIAKQMSGWTT